MIGRMHRHTDFFQFSRFKCTPGYLTKSDGCKPMKHFSHDRSTIVQPFDIQRTHQPLTGVPIMPGKHLPRYKSDEMLKTYTSSQILSNNGACRIHAENDDCEHESRAKHALSRLVSATLRGPLLLSTTVSATSDEKFNHDAYISAHCDTEANSNDDNDADQIPETDLVTQEPNRKSSSKFSTSCTPHEKFITYLKSDTEDDIGIDFAPEPQTYLGLSLLVVFFFNLPLGLVAVCLSLSAGRAYIADRKHKGDCRARTALVISLLGILITSLTVIIILRIFLWDTDGAQRTIKDSGNM